MNAVAATASYEAWLRTQLGTVLDDDLALKHRRMAADDFSFLRATYYLWLERAERHLPDDLRRAPAVVAIGDLHIENFGCWRDRSGALAWGVNDFDELAPLPYTYDLVRLCASAALAVREERLPLHEHDVYDCVLDGYRTSLAAGGQPFVADAGDGWLAALVARDAVAAGSFWRRLDALPAAPPGALPADGRALLTELAPLPGWQPVLHRRTAGLGSLGHLRIAAVGAADTEPAARELKELCPPATVWLGGEAAAAGVTAGPSWQPDPLLLRRGRWQGRRLAPDCVRLELTDYHRGAERRLLTAMGFETANIHQRAEATAVAAVRTHVARLTAADVRKAAEDLLDRVAADRHDWAQVTR